MNNDSTVKRTAAGIKDLQNTAAEMDVEINKIAVEILALQKKMSSMITQRDAVIAASKLLSDYQAANTVYDSTGKTTHLGS